MKPYYENEGITIYHGDCREVLPNIYRHDLLLTDPPYGIGADKNLRANKQHGRAACPSRDYGVGDWDSVAPDKEVLKLCVSSASESIIFGGNFFSLPPSACWLVWDKDNGTNGYADCELAWTNIVGSIRKIRFRWMGMIQENMKDKEYRWHPTQKPIPVMVWSIKQAKGNIKTVLDCFMGSGTTLVAAKNMGLVATGIEREERYCEAAAKRLQQGVLFGGSV